MDVRTPLYRSIALGASCAIHAGLAAGLLVVGLDVAASRTSSVVMAELVPAEPPRQVEPPPRPRPAPRLPFKTLTLPKPISMPAAEPTAPRDTPPPVEPREPIETVREVEPAAPAAILSPPSAAPARSAVPEPPSARIGGQPAAVTAITGDAARETNGSDARRPPSSDAPASAPGPIAREIPGGLTQTAVPRGGYQVRPSYPGHARRLGIQGTTTLRIYVSADGRVTEIVVEQSAGHPDLDHAATDAVRRWRFEPARRGTEAVGMWVLLPVEFRLR